MYNLDMEKLMKKYSKRKLTRSKAIKLYCKEVCSAGDTKSWRDCNFYACFLWQFRLGRETLSKPQSFKKQGKTSIKIAPNSESKEVSE